MSETLANYRLLRGSAECHTTYACASVDADGGARDYNVVSHAHSASSKLAPAPLFKNPAKNQAKQEDIFLCWTLYLHSQTKKFFYTP